MYMWYNHLIQLSLILPNWILNKLEINEYNKTHTIEKPSKAPILMFYEKYIQGEKLVTVNREGKPSPPV